MDDFELEIKREFLNEALMNLEEVESSFVELETASEPKPLLDKIFRLAHNLKGGSRAAGFGEVAEFTHELENLVLKIQKSEVELNREVVTTLLRSNDRLVEMLSELKANMAATFDNAEILADIRSWLEGKKAAPAPAAELPIEPAAPPAPPADQFFAEAAPVAVASAPKTPAPASAPVAAAAQANAAPPSDEVIRVSLSRIDLLNDYVGELIVLQSVVQQQTLEGNSPRLHASMRQMVKLSKDIQSLSMSLRMLPVKPLVQKLQRAVRDTANVLNKDVVLAVNGEQMEIDKSVLDRLGDPLIHIVRNAVDHGLEDKEERAKSGKNPGGVVTLTFGNEGNHLVITVEDDGRGVNTEVVRKKALEKGLISEGQALSEKQLLHLLFHPGFSTKAVTSEISGRGVGMDVVKTNVENMGGQVDISTVLGKGSVFRLQIPLSLAVIEGFVVTTGGNRYVVPLNQVQESVNLSTQKIHSSKLGIGSCFELRGTVVPLFPLEGLLGGNPPQEISGTALIIQVEDRPMAIVVNDILRAQQIVIKPFSNGIVPKKGWIGTCVLGDGLPTLILGPIELLKGRTVLSRMEQPMGRGA